MTRRTMRCPLCDSEDVVKDAWVCWNREDDEWEIQSIFDQAFCTSCENSIEIVEIEGNG